MPNNRRSVDPKRLLKTRTSALVEYARQHRVFILLLICFSVNLMLISPSLMPEMYAINPDDEAKYVDSGWRLLKGDLRELSLGPIVALVYAPIHIFTANSPDWFMIENWAGRFILFTFLWWSFVYLMYKVKEDLSPFIMAGLLFVAAPFTEIVNNQSDAVFLGFSALALAKLLKFSRDGKLVDLGLASLFVGLGVLARVESITLLAAILIFGFLIGRQKFNWTKILLISLIPAMTAIGGYFISSLILSGTINPGLSSKSYEAFEVGQQVLTGGDYNLAIQESRRLFGTQEENQGSVIRAIFNNPPAFALRVLANIKLIPAIYFQFFGKKLGFMFLIFSLCGVYALIRKKEFLLTAVLLGWAAFSFPALGFFTLHLIPQISYLPFVLSAIGVNWLFSTQITSREQKIVVIVSIILLLILLITGKPAFWVGLLLVELTLLISWLVNLNSETHPKTVLISMFMLLSVGLILRAPFQFPNYPPLGISNSEAAIHFIESNFPSQSNMLVPSPLPAIASKMSYLIMDEIPGSITGAKDFWSFLNGENVRAVYLDSNRRVRNDLYDIFESEFTPYFSIIYTSPDGTIRIFELKESVK